ncbi:MFS transporter [Arthrobacter sp. USHLN218]|uniref:MFS transporter n=1 Tax=Arthrobacter sp. USHLN218 TaxID=3081232 RepID=UPI00301667CA
MTAPFTPTATAGAPLTRGTLPWKRAGMLMAITFSGLQMLNEIGAMMAIPLYQSMSLELGLTPAQVSWALLSTLLMGAASIPLLSKAGDLFGHRRVMIICILGILAGYVISALAGTFAVLVIGRALTGIMAGQALVVGIMNDRLSNFDRKKAIGVIAGGQAIGVTFGFGLGGLMVVLDATWRTTFWVGAALTVLSLVGMLLWGSDSDAVLRNQGRKQRLDVTGVALLGFALTAICIGISQSSAWGFFSPATLTWIIAGAAGLVLALVAESRSKQPLVDVSLLLSTRLLPAYLVFISLGIAGIMLFNFVMGWAMTPPQLAGYGFGLNPLTAGFLFIPMTIAGIVVSVFIPRLLHRVPPRAPLAAGAFLLMLSFIWLYFMHTQLWAVIVGILFYGVAYTTVLTIAISIIAAEAPEGKGAGTASIYVGIALSASSIGTAIYAAIIGLNTTPAAPLPPAGNYSLGFLTAAIVCIVAIVAAFALSKSVRLTEVASH